MTWYRYDPARAMLQLDLQVQPNARRSEFVGLHGERLKVRIAAPPLDNKANQLLLEFIAERFRLPRGKVMIAQGERSRAEIVQISGVGPDVLATISDLNDD